MSIRRRAGCEGKSTLQSWAVAARVAKQMRRRWHEPIQPYRCQHCSKYHVGGR